MNEFVKSLSPINTPWVNFSAWQQPFWERISKGHCGAPHRSTELWAGMHTHKDTHIHTHAKIQTCKHSLTHARAVMYIIPDAYSMYERVERLKLSLWNPTIHLSPSLLWCLWPTTHTRILPHWHPLPIRTRSLSVTYTLLFSYYEYCPVLQEVPRHIVAQLSVKCCNGACVCTVHSPSHYCHCEHTHTHTQGHKV